MKPVIEFTDFDKLELRVGVITAAGAPEWSRKLLEFTVDFGPEIGMRTILSGIRQWYSPEEFVGKRFPFIVNLAERKMGEGVSQGMMMMADTFKDGQPHPTVTPFPDHIEPGTVIR
jgi:methionine--tRNA ligase beta chain